MPMHGKINQVILFWISYLSCRNHIRLQCLLPHTIECNNELDWHHVLNHIFFQDMTNCDYARWNLSAKCKIGIYCQQNMTKWFNKAYVAYAPITTSKRYK